MRRVLPVLGMVGVVVTGPVAAQAPLPLGTRVAGEVNTAGPTRYRFTPTAAGVLLVTVSSDADVAIEVTDVDGQTLTNGNADLDLSGHPGLEYLAVPITVAEPVIVAVIPMADEAGPFHIEAVFIADSSFALPPDPDRRPGLARALTVGESRADALDPSAGDGVDWYTVTAADAGSLVFITRPAEGGEGDLVLRAYINGDLSAPAAESDQDLQGSAANESVTVMVQKGDRVDVRVGPVFDNGGRIDYRLSAARVP